MLQMVVLYTNTCQMDKGMMLNVMIFHWALDYDIWN